MKLGSLLPQVAHAELGEGGLAHILMQQDTNLCVVYAMQTVDRCTGIAIRTLTFRVGNALHYHGIQGTWGMAVAVCTVLRGLWASAH